MVTVWVDPYGNGSSGVKIAVDPLAETVPARLPTRNEVVVTDPASTVRLNVTVTAEVAITAVAPSGGTTEATERGAPAPGVLVGPDSEHAAAMRIASTPVVD
jgi:hypothetical protein